MIASIHSPTTMDYSAHDPDHPAGDDPWASSPQANRSSFGQPPTNDIPSSPLPAQASPYGENSEQYGYLGEQDAQSRPGTAPENGDQSQQQQAHGQDAPRSPQPQQQGQQGQQPQRYHGTRPQRQQQQQQQYRLQAKVTGLERNGKKDPILRFDVYVRLYEFNMAEACLRSVLDIEHWVKVALVLSAHCCLAAKLPPYLPTPLANGIHNGGLLLTSTFRRTFPSFALLNSAMSDVYTLNS